ncbi:hypothetical protein [Streptomyces sp. NPDC056682]|uniref:hypothetical protein n=1 Tax=Streptomyces sp. NPDC056682 TaxID=3345909 RepID=UPI003686FB74
MTLIRRWTDIDPADAKDLDLTKHLEITAPRNEAGERCPWPWDPQQLAGAPIGQYHCGYCGAMVLAGVPHLDYAPDERVVTAENIPELYEWIEQSKIRTGAGADGRLEVIGLTLVIGDERIPALIGDTIVRDCDGGFTVRKAGAEARR